MSHEHHEHHCYHELKFCSLCDIVYCQKCLKEWWRKSDYSWTYTSPLCSGTTVSGGTSSIFNKAVNAVNHTEHKDTESKKV